MSPINFSRYVAMLPTGQNVKDFHKKKNLKLFLYPMPDEFFYRFDL